MKISIKCTVILFLMGFSVVVMAENNTATDNSKNLILASVDDTYFMNRIKQQKLDDRHFQRAIKQSIEILTPDSLAEESETTVDYAYPSMNSDKPNLHGEAF